MQKPPSCDEIPEELVVATRKRVGQAGLSPTEDEFNGLLAYVWPAMKKMKVRDDKYRAIREKISQPSSVANTYANCRSTSCQG